MRGLDSLTHVCRHQWVTRDPSELKAAVPIPKLISQGGLLFGVKVIQCAQAFFFINIFNF